MPASLFSPCSFPDDSRLHASVRAVAARLLALALPQVHAATCDWTGGSGNWHDLANWSCAAIPAASDDVTISNLNNGTITVDAAAPAQSIAFNSYGTISGTGALNVSGLASFSAFATTTIATNTPSILANSPTTGQQTLIWSLFPQAAIAAGESRTLHFATVVNTAATIGSCSGKFTVQSSAITTTIENVAAVDITPSSALSSTAVSITGGRQQTQNGNDNFLFGRAVLATSATDLRVRIASPPKYTSRAANCGRYWSDRSSTDGTSMCVNWCSTRTRARPCWATR